MKTLARCLLLFAITLLPQVAAAWDSTRLEHPVMINGHIIPYPVFAIFVMPGTPISAGFVDAVSGAKITFDGREVGADIPEIIAPEEPGLSVLELRNALTGETGRVHVFTMVPAKQVGKDGRLNGYRIDAYPHQPLRGLDIYQPPRGFVEVTAENAGVRLSPNFTLGEFVSKQPSGYPKYVVLRSSLLLKLENILASLNNAGHRADGLVIMSGYRTPFYNRSIGNVQYSRHVWGGAADIYVDNEPRDGRMDDMNGDGKVDRNDAKWFASFVEEMSRKGKFGPRIGGLGVYGTTSAHGPFIHVDVRGTRARW